MFPDLLASLLASGLNATTAAAALEQCDLWFEAAPGVGPFALRALFADLVARWPDAEQGAPADDVARFDSALRPRLLSLLENWPTSPGDPPSGQTLDDLLQAYHAACHDLG